MGKRKDNQIREYKEQIIRKLKRKKREGGNGERQIKSIFTVLSLFLLFFLPLLFCVLKIFRPTATSRWVNKKRKSRFSIIQVP
jgi:hypothetical protein